MTSTLAKIMNRRAPYKLFSILIVAVVLSGCNPSPTVSIPEAKLSSEEVGSQEAMAPYLSAVTQDVKNLDSILSNAAAAKEQQNFGIANKYYDSANLILFKWRDHIISTRSQTKHLVYPESMAVLERAFHNLYGLKYSLPESGPLTDTQLNQILNYLREVRNADIAFSNSISSRQTNPDLIKPKVSLNLELKPFPFKIDILSGEFKIKQSFSLGPLKADIGLGGSGSRTGIRTLILIHGDNVRCYSVGNRTLSFDVPACHIDINGQVMTITTLTQ